MFFCSRRKTQIPDDKPQNQLTPSTLFYWKSQAVAFKLWVEQEIKWGDKCTSATLDVCVHTHTHAHTPPFKPKVLIPQQEGLKWKPTTANGNRVTYSNHGWNGAADTRDSEGDFCFFWCEWAQAIFSLQANVLFICSYDPSLSCKCLSRFCKLCCIKVYLSALNNNGLCLFVSC